MPISFMCPNCGKPIQVGRKCECMKRTIETRTIYRPQRVKPSGDNLNGASYGSDPMYHSALWKRLCSEVIARYNHMDIYSWYVYGRIEPGEIVHHIVPIKDDYDKRFEINNLIYLTRENHAIIHQAYSQSEEQKTEMQQKLISLVKKWSEEKSCGFSRGG